MFDIVTFIDFKSGWGNQIYNQKEFLWFLNKFPNSDVADGIFAYCQFLIGASKFYRL